MTGATIPAIKTDAQRILREAYADCGCGIPSPFDEVAEHAVTLAEAKGFERGRQRLADQPSPPVVERAKLEAAAAALLSKPYLSDNDRERVRLLRLAAFSSPTSVREAFNAGFASGVNAAVNEGFSGMHEATYAQTMQEDCDTYSAALAQGGEVKA